MQNSDVKLDKITVGVAAHSDPLKRNKGITLIALIITIIVMLILVGVTINVALNGGLFQKAETATKETEKELIKELVIASYVFDDLAAQNVILSFLDMPATGRELFKNLTASGFKLKDASGNIFTTAEAFLEANGGDEITAFNLNIQGKYGEYEGTIGKRGLTSEGITIKGEEPSNPGGGPTEPEKPETPDEPEVSWADNGDGTYTKGDTTVTVGETTYTNAEVLEKLGITESTGTYKGTWTVIGMEGDKLKLVSTSNVSKYSLGYADPKAIGINDSEKAIWSYMNAETTLDTVTQDITGIESARSINLDDLYGIIGEENIDKGPLYGQIWNYYYNTENSKVYVRFKNGIDDNWSDAIYNTYDSSQTFVNNKNQTVVIDSKGEEITLTYSGYRYNLDDEEKTKLGILATDAYWLASPTVMCDGQSATFGMFRMNNGTIFGGAVFSSNSAKCNAGEPNVYAIVSI